MRHADPQRLHALDAVRGFALLLGVAFHAALSFMPGWPPGIWAMVDTSPSPFLADAAFVAHIFRMSLFFLLAGFFARLLHQRLGTGGFCRNRLLRIGLPLVAGWVVLYPLILWIWIAGVTKSFDGNPPPMPAMPKAFGTFPLAHLWFLYQLLQLYAVTLLVRALVVRIDRAGRLRGALDALVSAMLRVPLLVLLLGIPVALALMALPMWFYWSGIPAPDQTVLPQLAPLVGYGVAFGFGWLVHRSRDALASIARHWLPNLLAGALAAAWMVASLRTSAPMAPAGFPANPFDLADGATLTKAGFAVMSGVAAWGLAMGITGAALRFLAGYSPLRRYIADASYWVYLAHLPVVAALQVWVGHWPLPWAIKYPFVLATSLAVLFASYHWLVRPTVVGQLLNGRRHPRRKSATEPPASPSPAPPPRNGGGAPVAELRGISKTFGKIAALDGVDLQVRSGELLAVLGPNGAGKSTAISLWLGLIEADGGDVSLLGGDPRETARRQGLGTMMQDVELPKELSARELVRLASSYYAEPLPLEETLHRAGVAAFAGRPYGKLSGGQKRLVQFAVAICGQPRVLFLDEPTVGLDVQARQALWASIRGLLAGGCSIVLTTHYLEEAEALADRVAVIARGRVIATGSVDDMRALVAQRRISCESRLSAAEVGGWPGVLDARLERDRLQLTASDPETVVRRLLAEDPTLARLEVRQAGLDEAFTELTREAA
jgi:ABC-type multidrug transport system ATPase subunit/peptidoglycan/LPS O-acetylase OafA/YrhL